MTPSNTNSNLSPLLVVISAPSGGGKTTLCRKLLAADPELTRAVTCTTRPPRQDERASVDYHFLEPGTFQARVDAGEFLEHAEVYGQRYGTLCAEVTDRLSQGKDVLLNVDVQGAATVREKARRDPQLGQALVSVFMSPASLAELERRLRRRGTETEASLKRRLGHARQEIAYADQFHYLLISTTIEEDLRRMQVILEAERMHSGRVRPPDVEPANGGAPG